jgi:hypothetical protein
MREDENANGIGGRGARVDTGHGTTSRGEDMKKYFWEKLNGNR